jgi:transposase InsO family protein
VGNQKNAKLVETAFYSVQTDLRQITLFHTDRGSEFKNAVVEEILAAFGIGRSLSAAGTPIDNAVMEAMYKTIKTEFIFGREFADMAEFKLHWFDYVNWYNNVRIHGSLGYMTPNEWHAQQGAYRVHPICEGGDNYADGGNAGDRPLPRKERSDQQILQT